MVLGMPTTSFRCHWSCCCCLSHLAVFYFQNYRQCEKETNQFSPVCGFSLLYYFLFMDSSYIKLFITFSYSFDAKLCVCLSTEVHFEVMLLPVPFLYSFSANKYNIMYSDNILEIFPLSSLSFAICILLKILVRN